MGLAWGAGERRWQPEGRSKQQSMALDTENTSKEQGLQESTDTSTYYLSPNLDRVPMAISQDGLKLPVESVMLHTYFP